MIRYILSRIWLVIATLTILAAVLFSVARALFPQAANYHDEIELLLAETIGQPVQIGAMKAEWHGEIGPHFTFSDLRLLDPDSGRTVTSFSEAGVSIDLVGSLMTLQLRLGELTLVGVDLALRRGADGIVTLEGFGGRPVSAGGEGSGERILQWLLAQQRLGLKGSRLVYRMAGDDARPLVFNTINLELRNAGQRHQFDGSATLPDDLGRQVVFSLDINGDLLRQGWQGELFVDAQGLRLARLLSGRQVSGLSVEEGVVDARVWMRWQDAVLQRVDGTVSAFGLQVAAVPAQGDTAAAQARSLLGIDALSGRIAWERRANGWEVGLDRFVLGREGRVWPFSRLNFARRSHQGIDELELAAGYLDIRDLLEFARLSGRVPASAASYLQDLQPTGHLRHVHLLVRRDDQGVGVHAQGGFEALAAKGRGKIPGASGLTGTFVMRNDSGFIELASRDVRIAAGRLFRRPVPLDRVDGRLFWALRPAGMQLAVRQLRLANDDLRVALRGDVDVPRDPALAPYIDMQGRFDAAPHALRRTADYLPVGIMKEKLTAWLERAPRDGRIPFGGFVYRGRTRDYPFDHGEGRFEVRFGVQDGTLQYHPDWPQLSELEGEVAFVGRRMDIEVRGGRSFNSSIRHARVTIANLKTRYRDLKIRGQVAGEAGDVLRYLSITPLSRRFGNYVTGVSASGDCGLTLSLDMTLGRHEPPAVSGSLELQRDSLLLADGAVAFRGLQGAVGFDNAGLHADRLEGRVMGMPATFAISTVPLPGEEKLTLVEADGRATAADLRRLVNISPFRHLDGATDWHGLMYIVGGAQGRADLAVTSELVGLSSSLPYPAAKPARQPWPLTVQFAFPRALDEPVYFSLGDDINGILDVDARMRLERGEIRAGQQRAVMPQRSGLRLAGELDALSFSQWLPYIEEGGTGDTGVGVNQVDAQVGLLEVFDHPFSEAHVRAARGEDSWEIRAESPELAGRILVPTGPIQRLRLDLERLVLKSLRGDKGKDIDPREFPALQLRSDRFVFDGVDYGTIDLVASKRPAGLHLDRLNMQSPVMKISARGDWVYVSDEHFSSFSIDFTSGNFGKAMSALGFSGTIKGGRSDIGVVARWSGTPADFALDRLDGTMHLTVKNGRMLDVEPGAGRLLGLFSLQALPRRLVLDFSDLFQKGFSFDVLKGSFSFSEGQARTSNLYMDGPAARIDVRGRVGLVDRDYDQRVFVDPHVATGLPVAGAVAGGVGLGAALLVIQELLRPGIEEASQLEYRITGSWDDPVIKQVGGGGAGNRK